MTTPARELRDRAGQLRPFIEAVKKLDWATYLYVAGLLLIYVGVSFALDRNAITYFRCDKRDELFLRLDVWSSCCSVAIFVYGLVRSRLTDGTLGLAMLTWSLLQFLADVGQFDGPSQIGSVIGLGLALIGASSACSLSRRTRAYLTRVIHQFDRKPPAPPVDTAACKTEKDRA